MPLSPALKAARKANRLATKRPRATGDRPPTSKIDAATLAAEYQKMQTDARWRMTRQLLSRATVYIERRRQLAEVAAMKDALRLLQEARLFYQDRGEKGSEHDTLVRDTMVTYARRIKHLRAQEAQYADDGPHITLDLTGAIWGGLLGE